ncbi:flavin-containing monooxygenase [Streptomyces sp. NBC_00009]|uniref:flavin-containing monooxygenase n=1 Tax=Streptomyces sp. NBC_00009 TaxID=2975620 RepID=UPI00325394E3
MNGQVEEYSVVVVGAGMGGIYALHRFAELGHSVHGFEGAPGVGGVWYHNAYPGARVDLESDSYSYMFDEELYTGWDWSERYAAQPEILRYLNYVADRLDVRRNLSLSTRVTSAQWNPEENRYLIKTDTGRTVRARYLVMATGNLSRPKDPDFKGLGDFEGEWYQTSHWPQTPVDYAGKRVAVIGTGSSGVQAATEIAKTAGHLYVMQRTPHYVVPAHNRPADPVKKERLSRKVLEFRDESYATPVGYVLPPPVGRGVDYSPEQRLQILETRWAFGGQCLLSTFTDQGTNIEINDVVSQFVRSKVAQQVDDPQTVAKLMPTSYPLGTRRLVIDTGYYPIFNQDNVSLVDMRDNPIERITATGIKTREAEYEVDVIVFALGFEAFTGALDQANVRNEHGQQPSDRWAYKPQTYLGLMSNAFPNLFTLTGIQSPSVLANFFTLNNYHVDLVDKIIGYAEEARAERVEPTLDAEKKWGDHCNEIAEPMLRRAVDNYMVHVNRYDGSRFFLPYAGGFDRYVADVDEYLGEKYEGFEFTS